MSELREKIAQALIRIQQANDWNHSAYGIYTSRDALKEILSLIDSSPVEGLEVVSECNACHTKHGTRFDGEGCPSGVIKEVTCFKCHGTGEIVRLLTRGEMEEWAKDC